MKTILIPVDFSDASAKAFQFALVLNRHFFAQIQLLHIFDMPFVRGEGEVVFDAGYSQLKKNYEDKLWDFINLYKTEWQYDFSVSAHAGGHYTGIVAYIREFKPELVIMGNRGIGGLRRLLLGSVSRYLLSHSPVPVIAVPDHTETTSVENVLFTADLSEREAGFDFSFLKSFVKSLNANLRIIHVKEYGVSVAEYKQEDIDWIESNLECRVTLLTSGKGQGITDVINDFVHHHPIDMLVTIPHYHTWIDRLLIGSETAEIARIIEVPLLALPGKVIS